jgi:hypothetical protein
MPAIRCSSPDSHNREPRGRGAAHLFYLGPMLRADYWETTSVGELRVHAQQLATALARIDA